MHNTLPMHSSPRCGAKTRAETPCQSPAMANGRCRMHGGKSPGAPKRNSNALKHGRYTSHAIAERRAVASLIQDMQDLAEKMSAKSS
ncbi:MULTISPECIES: HGGxSTG domain-containing protein [Halocynthiibacter]|uniref:HGGxSTG domain-containing protein n=1 Tax=Halocynthiibacter TaxID=1579315 RepID=UPI0029394E2D|nr:MULTISPECIES: HGGxSTG domain-containing protein [Halocynthiibacter]